MNIDAKILNKFWQTSSIALKSGPVIKWDLTMEMQEWFNTKYCVYTRLIEWKIKIICIFQ